MHFTGQDLMQGSGDTLPRRIRRRKNRARTVVVGAFDGLTDGI